MESFFASIKAVLVHHVRFSSLVEARAQILHYIEAFYNRKRLHSSLGYLSPTAYKANAMTGYYLTVHFAGGGVHVTLYVLEPLSYSHS
jgi:hypothetical protein